MRAQRNKENCYCPNVSSGESKTGKLRMIENAKAERLLAFQWIHGMRRLIRRM
jgi:hypothetical protein